MDFPDKTKQIFVGYCCKTFPNYLKYIQRIWKSQFSYMLCKKLAYRGCLGCMHVQKNKLIFLFCFGINSFSG